MSEGRNPSGTHNIGNPKRYVKLDFTEIRNYLLRMTETFDKREYDREWERKNRKGSVVTTRFTDEELERIDKVRGSLSRAGFLKEAALKALEER